MWTGLKWTAQLQAKLKEKIQYEDLAGEEDTAESTGGPALRLTKMDRYLHGPTPVSAMQYKTSDDVLRAHQRVMHDMLAWKPDLSQVGREYLFWTISWNFFTWLLVGCVSLAISFN